MNRSHKKTQFNSIQSNPPQCVKICSTIFQNTNRGSISFSFFPGRVTNPPSVGWLKTVRVCIQSPSGGVAVWGLRHCRQLMIGLPLRRGFSASAKAATTLQPAAATHRPAPSARRTRRRPAPQLRRIRRSVAPRCQSGVMRSTIWFSTVGQVRYGGIRCSSASPLGVGVAICGPRYGSRR